MNKTKMSRRIRWYRLLGTFGLACFAYLCMASCGEPEPRIDLNRFPHVLELAPRVANAQTSQETWFIDLGEPSAHAAQVANWGDDGIFEGDGSTFAWSLGTGSSLQLVVLEPRRLDVTARLRPYRIDGPAQQVAIEANGNPVTVLRLKGGMRTYHFELPAGVLVQGRNLLELRNIYPPDIDPQDVGSPDLGPPGTAWDYLMVDDTGTVTSPSVADDVLFLPVGTAVTFHAEVQGATLLTLESLESTGRRGRLYVDLRVDGGQAGEPADAFERQLRRSSDPLVLDLETSGLEKSERSVLQLTLTSVGNARSKNGSGLWLRKPRLRSTAEIDAAPTSIAATSTSATSTSVTAPAPTLSPPSGRPPNVLIYLVDTLRADHLGCYGYPRPTSPAIDAFAAESMVFENAYAQSSWTRTSVASLFTGLHPSTHAVLGRNHALSEEATTLAEMMRRQGYATAAFVTNRSVSERFGFAQGFETFEYMNLPNDLPGQHIGADTVHRAIATWFDQPRRRPFLLYVHTLDPHAPYQPPEKELRTLAPQVRPPTLEPAVRTALEDYHGRVAGSVSAPVEAGSLTWIRALSRQLVAVEPAMVEDLVSLYDAEILFNDQRFGELLASMKDLGIYDDTIIVFVSDHGEEFHDHGGWLHGQTLYQEQLRVPFILRLPGGPEGLRFEHPAQHIDLLPTLADLLGLALPPGVQGESLAARWRDPRPGDPQPGAPSRRPVYSSLDLDSRSAESLVRGRFKLICAMSPESDGEQPDCELFDLLEDPGEKLDLSSRRPVLVGYLRQWLGSFRRVDQGPEAIEAEIDAEIRQQLEALGYL